MPDAPICPNPLVCFLSNRLHVCLETTEDGKACIRLVPDTPSDPLDSIYKPNMTLEEGIECMKKCFKEINQRFLMGGSTFTLKVCCI
jgi:hypothetical protein